ISRRSRPSPLCSTRTSYAAAVLAAVAQKLSRRRSPAIAGSCTVRNTFTITITDFRGARHYPIRQIAKTYALLVALCLLGTFLVGAGIIYWLSGRVETLNQELADLQHRRQLTQAEYVLLLEEHERLQQAIAEKEDRKSTRL